MLYNRSTRNSSGDSSRRQRTCSTKYNRLVYKFRHRSTRLCIGTQV